MKYYKGVKIDGIKHDYHRLVMEEKLGRKLQSNELVHHKDGNIFNNDPKNLELMSRNEHGRLHGIKNPRLARLKEDDIAAIRALLKSGMGHREIARLYGVGKATITDINRGHTWSWVKSLF